MSNDAAATAPSTKLPGELNDQPWLDYSFGQCINAATGGLAVPAVTSFSITPSGSMNTQQTISVVASDEDYQSLFEAQAQGSYGMGGNSASASASFLQQVAVSETTLTIVAFCDIGYANYAQPTATPTLVPAAAAMAQSDPTNFRNVYGDYYVAAAKFGSRFAATYTCSATSVETFTSFKTAVQGQTDVFSASGAAALVSAASSSNVDINVSVFMDGVSGSPPVLSNDPGAVPAQLAWFQANLSAEPRLARLIHLSELAPNLPSTLPIDPNNFAVIQLVSFQLVELNSTIKALPAYYETTPYQLNPPQPGVQTVADAQTYLTNQFTASLDMLAYDPALAQQFSTQVSALTASLKPALTLYSFYQALVSTNWNEPGSGVDSTAVGMQPGAPVAVQIQSSSQNYSADWHIGHRSNDFTFPWSPYDGTNIITGWYIHNVWDSSSNGNWSLDGPMIGKSSGGMSVRSNYDRGCDWTFYVYFTSMSSFPWLPAPTP